jgi:hypothetical protein
MFVLSQLIIFVPEKRQDNTFSQRYPGHFLRIRQWGGQLQKGTILYQVWRNDRWLLVTKILVWYGI